MRQYDRAINQFLKALEFSPHLPFAQIFLGQCYIAMGKLDEGVQACELGVQLLNRNPLSLALLGGAYALAGQVGEAKKLIAELQNMAEKVYVPSSAFAAIYAGLGEIDKAFDLYETAIEERDTSTQINHILPIFDPIRSHPRYKALLRKMNLES